LAHRNKAQDSLSTDVLIQFAICSSPFSTLAILISISSLSNSVLNQGGYGQDIIQLFSQVCSGRTRGNKQAATQKILLSC